MTLDYDKLRQNAREVRAELFEKGAFDPGRPKRRRKPRTREESDMLYQRAMERAVRYTPYYNSEGKLVLPYLSRTG